MVEFRITVKGGHLLHVTNGPDCLLMVDTGNVTTQSLGQMLVSILGVDLKKNWQEIQAGRLEGVIREKLLSP